MGEEGLWKCAIIMEVNHMYHLTLNTSSKVLLLQIASFI